MGEEGVLLGLVEAMDLVEEQHGPGAVQRDPVLRLGDQRADVGDAGHDRRDRREMGTDLAGQQPGEARLAGAGRAPQDQAREVPAGDAPPQRAALTDEVRLADELVQAARAHPRGQRLGFGRWLEERLGSGADRTAGGGHVPPMVARWAVGTARRSAGGQILMPVTWVTIQIAISRAIIDPPISAIRRTSRAT